MGLIDQINALIWGWVETFRAFSRRVALLPFAIYAAGQAAILAAIGGFAYPVVSWFMVPLLRWRFGESVLHYPNNFLVLRAGLGELDPFLAVFLGAVTAATGIVLFGTFYQRRRVGFGEAWSRASSRYWSLVVAAVIAVGLAQIVTRTSYAFFGYLAEESPRTFRVVRGSTILVVLFVQAVLVYTAPYIVLAGRSVRAAVGGSLVLFGRTPVATFLLVAMPAALEILPLWLWRQSATIAHTFSPVLVPLLMVIWVVVLFFATYVTLGGITRLFLHLTQDEAPGAAVPGAGGEGRP
jgi:hypothetical protein